MRLCGKSHKGQWMAILSIGKPNTYIQNRGGGCPFRIWTLQIVGETCVDEMSIELLQLRTDSYLRVC